MVFELNDLKKVYEDTARNHKLPGFKELNEDFEIEKIEKESNYLLRQVRKIMMEKIVNTMQFLEMIVNPMNAPRMYIPYIKSLGVEDRAGIDRIYGNFADLVVLSLELEIGCDEKKEAELINTIFKSWNDSKPALKKIFENIRKPNNSAKKERNYFG